VPEDLLDPSPFRISGARNAVNATGSSIYVKAPKGCKYDFLPLNESMPYIIDAVNPARAKILNLKKRD